MTFMASLCSYETILPSLIFLIFLFNFIKRNRGPLPWSWPLLGMLPTLFVPIPKIHDKICDILQRNNATFELKGPWFMNFDRVFTCDPANVNHILSTNFSGYDKDPMSKHVFEVLGDRGFFTLKRKEWKSLRTTLRKLFGDQRFTWTMGMLVKDNLEKRLIPLMDYASMEHEVVDFQALVYGIMFDSACTLLSGYDSCALSNFGIPMNQLSQALDDVNEITISRTVFPKILWKLLKWLRIGAEKKMSTAKKAIDEVAEKLIKRKQQDILNNQGFDVLKFFIHEDVECRDDSYLKDFFVGVLFAARDTTSLALTWFFWLLSKNPTVESKIRQELVSHLPSNEAQKFKIFSIEELRKLPYLHAALSETLRLYPSAPFQRRVSLKADILPSGHHVKRNAIIILSLYAMGRMTSVWGDDCLEFRPERWISEGHFKYELSNKFLCAFSAGPRVCPGKDASFMSMKMIAANIVHNYDLRVIENEPSSFRPTLLLVKNHGLKVQVTKKWT